MDTEGDAMVKVRSYKRKVRSKTIYSIYNSPLSQKEKHKYYLKEYKEAVGEKKIDWKKVNYLARGLQITKKKEVK